MKKFLLILAICPAAMLSVQDAAPSPGRANVARVFNSTPATAADVQALRQEVQSLTQTVKTLQQQVKDQQTINRQNASRGRRSVFAKPEATNRGENRFASACFRRTKSVSD